MEIMFYQHMRLGQEKRLKWLMLQQNLKDKDFVISPYLQFLTILQSNSLMNFCNYILVKMFLQQQKKDFETKNRKKFCSRIATGEWDAAIIGHSQFEKIPMSIERQIALLEEQINDITEKSNQGEIYTIKQMEKTLETRLAKLHKQERKDDVMTFEELGVDKLLFV